MIISSQPLGFIWPTLDPFLFCAFHRDDFPKANANGGPATSLAGRQIGQDFTIKDGFRMYHGQKVPGFPAHPHRGFETVTIVPQGWVDHADSLGGKGRYGQGDLQWMTAGKGIQHSEMFTLLDEHNPNPMTLFQIWLNLPAKNKMVEPNYKMIWHNQIPQESQNNCTIKWYAGKHQTHKEASPPPHSWANDINNEVLIIHINMDENGQFQLPPSNQKTNRCLYFYQGESCSLKGDEDKQINIDKPAMLQIDSQQSLEITTKQHACQFLLLQGKAIDEPVAHHGPFVMNNHQELQQAFNDYQQTQFGGWPFENGEVTHNLSSGRFAIYDNGTKEQP